MVASYLTILLVLLLLGLVYLLNVSGSFWFRRGGTGLFAHVFGPCWFRRRWGHLDMLLGGAELRVEAV